MGAWLCVSCPLRGHKCISDLWPPDHQDGLTIPTATWWFQGPLGIDLGVRLAVTPKSAANFGSV